MDERKEMKRALIPHHFDKDWDIIPQRSGVWETVYGKSLSTRVSTTRALRPDLVVSGDCFGALGAYREGLALVWMDAHGDFNTPETTATGSLGGMPLAIMAGLVPCAKCLFPNPVEMSIIHIAETKAGFDSGEAGRMARAGVSLAKFLYGIDEKIHLHIDMDVISSDDVPSNIHGVRAGMPLSRFWEQLDVLLPQTKVLSVKTYDPQLDVSQRGQEVCLQILEKYDAVWNQ